MKTRVTKKFLKENYKIINIGNNNLRMLDIMSPDYYCTRVEGWACDAYIVGDYAILEGYDCTGKLVPYDIIKKYDDKAKEVWDKYYYGNSRYYTYNRVRSIHKKLLNQFIQEVIKCRN